MFGFMPPAPQGHMMRAGVLSRGIVDEIVTQESDSKYSSTASKVKKDDAGDDLDKLNIPIGLGASDAQIRKQMPAGWKPGDPVDLPLDALLHYMGRSFFTVHGKFVNIIMLVSSGTNLLALVLQTKPTLGARHYIARVLEGW